MAFDTYSDPQLKKIRRILHIASIFLLLVMCFVLGMGLYQSTKNDNDTLIYLVPTVFAPLTFIPILFSTRIGAELNKRQQKDS